MSAIVLMTLPARHVTSGALEGALRARAGDVRIRVLDDSDDETLCAIEFADGAAARALMDDEGLALAS